MKLQVKKYFGPSTLVTAAFIGPGTVTVCTLAGVNSGYTLLWALFFSVIATIVLQEMTARLGLITQKGFGEAIRGELQNPLLRIFGITLVLGAIVIGNAAYEGGNISGAVLGWNEVLPAVNIFIEGVEIRLVPLIIGGIAFWLLYSGNFKRIQNFLIGLVVVMSVVFLATAIMIVPDLSEIIKGLFIPTASADEILLVVALIGTTVVPYNLFLHASSVQQKYSETSQLSDLRKENMVAIILGGIISMCIVITSAASGSSGSEIKNAADMAVQLEPLLGSWAKDFLGLGLVAAGISSAITAPLAAAFAAKGILGWDIDLKHPKFKAVWIIILIIGVLFSMLSFSPVSIIHFAQVANGILLPLVAIFLMYVVNQKKILGDYVNTTIQNILGSLVVLVALLVGFRSLNNVFQFL
ncbi:divalent metal cation transporter [bacterium]|jgi:NRAMP (natural resistance-associated macrophage protein)-like metal ion transporter|nr:Nramp family divalent metal transporter [Balneola sp.]MBR9916994.1 divalent metal cation transporter [bacterium]